MAGRMLFVLALIQVSLIASVPAETTNIDDAGKIDVFMPQTSIPSFNIPKNVPMSEPSWASIMDMSITAETGCTVTVTRMDNSTFTVSAGPSAQEGVYLQMFGGIREAIGNCSPPSLPTETTTTPPSDMRDWAGYIDALVPPHTGMRSMLLKNVALSEMPTYYPNDEMNKYRSAWASITDMLIHAGMSCTVTVTRTNNSTITVRAGPAAEEGVYVKIYGGIREAIGHCRTTSSPTETTTTASSFPMYVGQVYGFGPGVTDHWLRGTLIKDIPLSVMEKTDAPHEFMEYRSSWNLITELNILTTPPCYVTIVKHDNSTITVREGYGTKEEVLHIEGGFRDIIGRC